MPEWLIALNMALTLRAGRALRFSETARSHPAHHEAGGHRQRPRSVPVDRRRLTHDAGERAAERAEAREADVEADLGHAEVGLAQQRHRALHPPALKVAVGSLAEGGVE